jgi:hypothetical protein
MVYNIEIGHITTAKRKAWQEEYGARPEVRARQAALHATPERKMKRRIYATRPEVRAWQVALRATPEFKARTKAKRDTPEAKARRAMPEAKARHSAYLHSMPIEIPNRLIPDCCECCGEISTATLHFDHCHDTGRFRGWCCHRCNCGHGLADNPRLLRLRVLYLERPFQADPIKWAYPKGWKKA